MIICVCLVRELTQFSLGPLCFKSNFSRSHYRLRLAVEDLGSRLGLRLRSPERHYNATFVEQQMQSADLIKIELFKDL